MQEKIGYSTVVSEKPIDYGKESFLESVGKAFRGSNIPPNTREIGVRWFQEQGILKGFLALYKGNAALVFEELFQRHMNVRDHSYDIQIPPEKVKQPLNNPFAPFYDKRHEEVNAEANAIGMVEGRLRRGAFKNSEEERLERVRANFRLWGINGKKRRNRKQINRLVNKARISDRKSEKQFSLQTHIDIKRVVQSTINQGDTVVCMMPTVSNALLPLTIMDQIRREGKLYVTDITAHTSDQLFDAITNYLVDYQKLKFQDYKQKPQIKKYRYVDPKTLVSNHLKFKAGTFLASKLEDEELYLSQFDFKNSNLPREFYFYRNIVPSNLRYLKTLLAIEPKSVNVIIADSISRFISEQEKQHFLWLCESRLKDGGFLLFRDSPLELAKLKYYGSDLFESSMRKISTGKPYHTASWMMYKKTSEVKIEETTTDAISTSVNGSDKKESQNQEEEQVVPQRKPVVIYQYQSAIPTGEKSAYSVKEVAVKAGVSVSYLQKRLAQMGIRPITNFGKGSPNFKKRQKQWQQFSYQEVQFIISRLKE